ncbi:MAG: esterase-like activity of phytase family protein [Parvibaculaceae bacterium]
MTLRNRKFPVGLALAATLLATASAGAAEPKLTALGRTEIPATGRDSARIDELSGLAWDADEKLLYAVSDRGVLHHFRLRLDGEKITGIEHVFSGPLAAPMANATATNAEGLAAVHGDDGKPGNSELLIAFEDGPGIARFTPRGQWIGDVALPAPLADAKNYAKKNSRLESVAFDKTHGVLTAPERPLRDEPPSLHKIYAADGATWAFEASQPDGRLKAIETMAGGFLVLERTAAEGGLRTAHLRYFDLAACAAGGHCAAPDLSVPSDPLLADNFEGLARLSDELFLLVADRTKKDVDPASFVLFKLTGAK